MTPMEFILHERKQVVIQFLNEGALNNYLKCVGNYHFIHFCWHSNATLLSYINKENWNWFI